jgi:hypothetical protein
MAKLLKVRAWRAAGLAKIKALYEIVLFSLHLQRLNPEISVYKDRRFEGDEASGDACGLLPHAACPNLNLLSILQADWERALRTSTTLYVGCRRFYMAAAVRGVAC